MIWLCGGCLKLARALGCFCACGKHEDEAHVIGLVATCAGCCPWSNPPALESAGDVETLAGVQVGLFHDSREPKAVKSIP